MQQGTVFSHQEAIASNLPEGLLTHQTNGNKKLEVCLPKKEILVGQFIRLIIR